MKKTRILSAAVSAAAAIAMLSAPVSAFYKNPIEEGCTFEYLCTNWSVRHSGWTCVYQNGTVLYNVNDYMQIIITPAEGITLTSELLGIPEKYTMTYDKDTGQYRLPKLIYIPDAEKPAEIVELETYVKRGIRKGLIAKAETEHSISGECLEEPRMAIKLKDEADIDAFIADYPEWELTADNSDVPDKCKDFHIFSKTADLKEILNNNYNLYYDYAVTEGNDLSLSRAFQIVTFGKSCGETHTISRLEPLYDEYYYVEDTENIAWFEENTDYGLQMTVYKNGNAYAGLNKKNRISFTTTDDYRNTSDFPDLPDNYSIENPDWEFDELSLKREININSQEELDEIIPLVRSWAEKGYITEPVIHRLFKRKGMSYPLMDIELKDENDFDKFFSDYPDYKIYDEENGISPIAPEESGLNPNDYDGDKKHFKLLLTGEQSANAPEFEEKLRSDNRVESAAVDWQMIGIKSDITAEDELIEYTASEPLSGDKTEYTQIRGDISGNNRIDLYDAIEIAKYIVGIRTFTEEETAIADINEDGKVDIYDAIEIAKNLISI